MINERAWNNVVSTFLAYQTESQSTETQSCFAHYGGSFSRLSVFASVAASGSVAHAQSADAHVQAILVELINRGQADPASGQAYWNSLSSSDQTAIAKEMADVTFVIGTKKASVSTNSTGCNDKVAYEAFYYAGGTIYGGNVTQELYWCWNTSGGGYITSNSCNTSYDVVWPWELDGFIQNCQLDSGGNGYQSVDRNSEGKFSNQIFPFTPKVYPCVETVGDAYGNGHTYDC